MNDDEVVMYIVVNSDLKMNKGKIAAQVGHAVQQLMLAAIGLKKNMNSLWNDIFSGGNHTKYIELHEEYKKFREWLYGSYPKVILKADYGTLESILKYERSVKIVDEGRTQIEKGSITVVGFFPMRRKDTPEEIKKLKLL